MKKILIIITVSFLIFSCTWWNQKIENAKKEMLWNTGVTNIDTINAGDFKKNIKEEQKKSNNIKIEYLTKEKYIELNAINEKDLKTWEIEITWKTLEYVDKIEVQFINSESDYPEDNYTLKKFKPWWDNFKYMASSRFRVLDFWKNIYIFTSYSWDKKSKLKLTIYLENPENKNTKKQNYEKKLIWTENDTVFLNLPVNDNFWKSIMLWEDVFTYSLIDNLEIKKKNIKDLNCENLTKFLTKNINTWFFWNTCRDIVKDKWISFYLIELKGDNYIYEKHYIDFVHGFYWIQSLEKWNGLSSENIKEKNDELKEKNDYKILEKTDILFKEIVNN